MHMLAAFTGRGQIIWGKRVSGRSRSNANYGESLALSASSSLPDEEKELELLSLPLCASQATPEGCDAEMTEASAGGAVKLSAAL